MTEPVSRAGTTAESAGGAQAEAPVEGRAIAPEGELRADEAATGGAPKYQGGDPYFSDAGGADRTFPRNPVRFALHAVFYCAGKVADRIVSLYSRTFRLDREYLADYSRSAGIACVQRGDWGKAIPMLEKALAMGSDDLETRMSLARAYSASDQHEKACGHLTQILDANPDSVRALRELGSLHSRKQDYERATEFLERAVKLAPDHAPSFYRLGTAYDNRKLYDDAVRSFRNAIRLDPRFSRAYQALGFTYESMGDRDSAVGCFKKALELE